MTMVSPASRFNSCRTSPIFPARLVPTAASAGAAAPRASRTSKMAVKTSQGMKNLIFFALSLSLQRGRKGGGWGCSGAGSYPIPTPTLSLKGRESYR